MTYTTVSQTVFVENLVSALSERKDRLIDLLTSGVINHPRSVESVNQKVLEIEECIRIIEQTANSMKIAS